jgi:hypothetical protein
VLRGVAERGTRILFKILSTYPHNLTEQHSVVVSKPRYKNWERKLKVTGGSVNLAAELEKTQ